MVEAKRDWSERRAEMDRNRRARRRRRLRASRRRRLAMTLVEIMIVVIIMALIAAAVGVAVVPQWIHAQVTTARTDAATIRGAVEGHVIAHSDGVCPTVGDLVAAGEIARSSRTDDPWGTPFAIDCERGAIRVRSAGPDRQFGTDDDVDDGPMGAAGDARHR